MNIHNNPFDRLESAWKKHHKAEISLNKALFRWHHIQYSNTQSGLNDNPFNHEIEYIYHHIRLSKCLGLNHSILHSYH